MTDTAAGESWYTEQEIADRYGVDVAVLRKWQRDGAGPRWRTRDHRRYFPESVIIAWEASLLPARQPPALPLPSPAPRRPGRSTPADGRTWGGWSGTGPGPGDRPHQRSAPVTVLPSPSPTGYVYVIGSELLPGVVKIGFSAAPERRLKDLQLGSPVRLAILWTAPAAGVHERALHRYFRQRRIHGEHFDFGGDDAVAAVRRAWLVLGARR